MDERETFEVNVNYPGGSVLVRVSPSWNVARVKEEVSRKTRISARDFRIVFAGEALADNQTLWDIGLQGYSTLHCIRFAGVQMVTEDMGSIKLDRVASNLGVLTGDGAKVPEQKKEQQRFFVYCKRPCGKMAPGKLRVRCADCKSSSFELTQGPGGWDDVLQPRRMHGKCHNTQCGRNDAEFYFKCAVHPTGENDDSVALHMIRANTLEVECAVCQDKAQQVVVFSCQQGHCMCVDCFIIYCKHQLANRQFIQDPSGKGYTIRCPAGCEGSEVTEIHHFRLMGKNEDGQDLYAKYQKFATEECILQMGGLLCPNRGCGEGLLPEDGGRRIQCPPVPNGCGFVFCRECRRSYHTGPCESVAPESEQGGQAYHVDPHNLERARWIEANERFIQTNTNIKPCPRCQVPIEKNGGCMHMTCSRAQCKYEWCWICGVEWNRDCQSAHWFG